MKTLLSFSLGFFICMHVHAQVRFTEIDVNTGNNYIELFASNDPDIDLGHYNIVVYNGTSWFNIDIPNTGNYIVGAKKGMYFIVGQTANIIYGGGKGSIKKADFVYSNGGNDFLIKNKSNYVFLLKNGKVIDVLVTQSTQLQAAQAIAALPYPSPITISDDGIAYNVRFSNVSVTSFSFANMNSGSGSYSLTTSPNCSTVWTANNSTNSTPGLINHGVSIDPVFYYFSSRMQYIQNGTWTDLVESAGLPFQNGSVVSSSPWTERFRYVISNFSTDFTPIYSNPEFEIWADGNGDNILDEAFGSSDIKLAGGTDYVLNANAAVASSECAFTFDIINKLKVYKADNTQRTLFFKFKAINNVGSCVINQNRMLMQSANLPVELTQFKANFQSTSVFLSWITASENNNKGFEVQRATASANEFKTFAFVGTRAKQGNSQTPILYSFEDQASGVEQDIRYRLKQVDNDGKYMYSNVQVVRGGKSNATIHLYPNPSSGAVTIQLDRGVLRWHMVIYDHSGRIFQSREIDESGLATLSNLKKGIYAIRIENPRTSEVLVRQLIIQ